MNEISPCPCDRDARSPLRHCPTHAVCPHCREGWGHLTDGQYVPTVESEAVPVQRSSSAPVGGDVNRGSAVRADRDCMCPSQNPDCEHPTCPRWPQPGHFAVEAAEVVERWEAGGKGYADLEQRVAVALAEAAARFAKEAS